jgi:hypothetical protein
MSSSKLAVIVASLALAGGIGVTTAFADESNPPPPPVDCNAQGVQNGPNDEQSAATDIAAAATEVDQEAENQQADDQSGDQQGPNDQSDEQGDDQCSDQGGDDGGDGGE